MRSSRKRWRNESDALPDKVAPLLSWLHLDLTEYDQFEQPMMKRKSSQLLVFFSYLVLPILILGQASYFLLEVSSRIRYV